MNFFIEDDIQDILGSLEGDPGSLIIIGTNEGGELYVGDNEVVINKSLGSPMGMNLTKVKKRGRVSSFSISK